MDGSSAVVNFIHMEDGSKEDYELLDRYEHAFKEGAVDRVLAHLDLLRGSMGGYRISRYDHCLQSATLAMRDGASEEIVVAALLHDIGDMLSPENHSEVAAAILKPFVREETHWIVRHHGLFQEYYYAHHLGRDRNARDLYRDNKHYDACRDFCARYDQNAFDPDYDTLPIETFEPMVRRVFARPPFEYFHK